jgi:cation diffusion facilitator CzcD-associated flavoprotein CzcO
MSGDNGRCQALVIGAGPYGLAAAAHLINAGVSVRVFGEPMETWVRHMPKGMLLRSRWDATHIADPDHALKLGSYEAEFGLKRHREPVSASHFVDYGRWFQQHAVPGLERRRVVNVYPDSHGFRVELEGDETIRTERVVVAAGIIPFAWRPPQFASLPPELASHTTEHSDLSVFKDRHVAVIGRGQSALESAALLADAGAHAEVFIRRGDIQSMITMPMSSLWRIARPRWATPRRPGSWQHRTSSTNCRSGCASAWFVTSPSRGPRDGSCRGYRGYRSRRVTQSRRPRPAMVAWNSSSTMVARGRLTTSLWRRDTG